jgi:hypothetical protein
MTKSPTSILATVVTRAIITTEYQPITRKTETNEEAEIEGIIIVESTTRTRGEKTVVIGIVITLTTIKENEGEVDLGEEEVIVFTVNLTPILRSTQKVSDFVKFSK